MNSKRYPVILDLETQYTFRDFEDHKNLKISVAGIYDYKEAKLKSFFEDELASLFPILENASIIIGFNIIDFDLKVFSSYYPGDTRQFRTFDILEDIRRILGRRISLNDLLKATLGKVKTGHGLDSINYYRQGQWEKLKQYCLDDVDLTREIFEYGVEKKSIYYLNEKGKQKVVVDWGKYLKVTGSSEITLTLPF